MGDEVEAPNLWDPETIGQTLFHDSSHNKWSLISNLDIFFHKVYIYYLEKGFWCMIISRFTNLLTLAFTIIFSTFLFLYIDWDSLLFCKSEDGCEAAIGLRSVSWTSPSFLEILVFLYFSVFSLFWIWNFISFIYIIRDAYEMQQFYEKELGINDDDLVSIEWHLILESLVVYQQTTKISIAKDLSALDITNRIMRKENYFMMMMNLNIFNLGNWKKWPYYITCSSPSKAAAAQTQQPTPSAYTAITNDGHQRSLKQSLMRAHSGGNNNNNNAAQPTPLLSSLHTSSLPPPTSLPLYPSTPSSPPSSMSTLFAWYPWAVFNTTLEWNLKFCVLNSMFDSHFAIRNGFTGHGGVTALKTRFITMGIINLILLPFIMIFMVIFFFLRHAEELHSKKTLFGPRQFSLMAQWKMRELNEMPHIFERRLTLASVAAQQYMGQFPSAAITIIAQSTAYISGAIVGILLLLTLADSDILTHRILDRTLLWYLALFSAILALSRSAIPDKNVFPAPALVMQEVIKHTHYFPKHWRNKTHTYHVQKEFNHMYPSRIVAFAYEILGVICAPFVLIFCLPSSCEKIVDFVQTCTVNVNGVGHLCSYAIFDFEKYGDPRASHTFDRDDKSGGGGGGAAANKKEEMKTNHATPLSSPTRRMPRLPDGKLEKSFLSFAMANPHWRVEEVNGGTKYLSSMAESLMGAPPLLMSRNVSEGSIGSLGSLGRASPMPTHTKMKPSTVEEEQEHDHEHEEEEEGNDRAHFSMTGSNQQLIQSFADLLGYEASLNTSIMPSLSLRQSSYGAAPQSSPLTRRQRSGMMHSSVLFHGSAMGGSVVGHTGGLQAGLSASTLLHMDTQAERESLMLAQADQNADLFATMMSRMDQGVEEGNEEEEEEQQDPPSFMSSHENRVTELQSSPRSLSPPLNSPIFPSFQRSNPELRQPLRPNINSQYSSIDRESTNSPPPASFLENV